MTGYDPLMHHFQESMVFLSTEDLQAMLELDNDSIVELSEAKVILSLNLSSGEQAFPDFQFRRGELYPELIVSFQKFSANHTGWDVAIWFHKWNENLRDFPVKLINQPKGLERIRLAIDVESSIASL